MFKHLRRHASFCTLAASLTEIKPVQIQPRYARTPTGPDGGQKVNFGHNSAGFDVNVEVRFFNSIARFRNGQALFERTSFPAGSDIADILKEYGIDHTEVFLIFVNGRDITPKLGALRTRYVLEDGDVVSLSGPVPYSWGYGAPVV